MDLTFELAPQPGTTLSQRKQQLNETRFVAVRNLAYIHYKKPDGTQLMSYNDTLADREIVKSKILEYELACGLIQDDGSGLLPQPQQPQATPANGAQNGHAMQPVPQQMPINAVMPAQQVAQMQPVPMQQQPVMQPAPQMNPMAFAPQGVPQGQVTQMPQAAPAAEAAAPGQRPSRRKINNTGAAVASPPAAPPAGPQPGAQVMQTQFQPAAVPVPQQQAPQVAPQPAPFQPAAFTPAVAPAAPAQAAPVAAPTAAPQVDLSQIIAILDQLGRGVSTAANNADQVIKQVTELTAKVVKIDNDQQRILAALHHLYMMNSNQALGTALGDCKTVPEFKKYLTTFALPPGTP